MGNSLDRLGGYYGEDSEPSPSEEREKKERCRKRGRGTKEEEGEDEPSVKITKLDTAKYVYDRLFLQGEGTDITVNALDHSWNLHKLYLQQCEYFQALINGKWKDSNETCLHLDIPDEKITVEGLHAVFGSLYHNEIEYKSEDIEAILAVASLFQLESVLARCDAELALELNETNVLKYLNISDRYGLKKVRKSSMILLKWNFPRLMNNKPLLSELQEDTFAHLLSSSELLVVEGEMDIYQMVKKWLFLRHSPGSLSLPDPEFATEMADFFSTTAPGLLFVQYASFFAALRLHHLVTSTGSIKEVERDNLIPGEVRRAVMIDQWKTALTNEENPTASAAISDEAFHLNCIRLGRIVDVSPKCWRWTGYNYGVDIILNYNQGLLTMKRNCLHQATPYSINLRSDRVVHFRLLVCDSDGSCIHDTNKQLMTMAPDQSIVICRLPQDVQLPVTVHLFYLASKPPPPSLLYVNQYVKSRTSQAI